jgi:hypothetical protein
MKIRIPTLALLGAALLQTACTIPASKQALWTSANVPPGDASTFVQEEDSGLSLFGLIQFTEPDHYAVLLERVRRRNNCQRIHHAQLDYFMDHWLLVAFPIARVTAVCEPGPPKVATQVAKRK